MPEALVKVHPAAQAARENFHASVVQEVAAAVARDKVVVVGMGINPVVKGAQRFLDERKVPYTFLTYGSYFSAWKERLAIKIWSGWPTFPQVFIKGALVGGLSELKKLAENGELERLLAD